MGGQMHSKTPSPIRFFGVAAQYHSVPRAIAVITLSVIFFISLLSVCGCHDVEGAASEAAGQMSERQKRSKEATDILDSATKQY
jgi:hypothetical protein